MKFFNVKPLYIGGKKVVGSLAIMTESAVIVIPARMASTRFPNKPLALIAGKTMIERVWLIGKASGDANEVIIATDDEHLRQFALGFGAKVIMTSPDCLTGTDRVAEASLQFTKHTVFFSLQGDAVLTPPWVIEKVLNAMLSDPSVQMATPAVRLRGQALTDFVISKEGAARVGQLLRSINKGTLSIFQKPSFPMIETR